MEYPDEVTWTMRTVNWPARGDAAAFRRRVLTLSTIGVSLTALGLGAATLVNSALLTPLLPLAGSVVLLTGLWAHGAARSSARRREVERSFAGLRVLHHGESFAIAETDAVIGEHPTRRHAASAAMDRGSWAVIVHAWDRYYLLAARPSVEADGRDIPVAFRSRAVSDVVPAIFDDVAAAG